MNWVVDDTVKFTVIFPGAGQTDVSLLTARLGQRWWLLVKLPKLNFYTVGSSWNGSQIVVAANIVSSAGAQIQQEGLSWEVTLLTT